VLTSLKNGQALVRATATDSSAIDDELRATHTGQSLAFLSAGKPVTVTGTIDQAKERINDGDPWAAIDLLRPPTSAW
jgi:hypothetical protein